MNEWKNKSVKLRNYSSYDFIKEAISSKWKYNILIESQKIILKLTENLKTMSWIWQLISETQEASGSHKETGSMITSIVLYTFFHATIFIMKI